MMKMKISFKKKKTNEDIKKIKKKEDYSSKE